MDLSWCIICDKRIEDDELSMIDSHNSLYCSQECKLKDNTYTNEKTTSALVEPINLFTSSPSTTTTSKTTSKKSTSKHLQYKSSTTYPWIPLYRKRHHNNTLLNTVKRCCQPTVAGSPITATAVLSSSLIH